jgi:hypothetical protein
VTLVALGGPGAAQDFQYVISFDRAVVRHPGDLVQAPYIAHAERLAQEATEADVSVQEGSTAPKPAPRPARRPRRGQSDSIRLDVRREAERRESPPAELARLSRTRPPLATAFAPGDGTANPSFVENGFLVEAFWSVRTGSPQGHFIRAHFHPGDLSTGFEGQHYGHTHELHGIYIRALDGKPFRLESLRYRVTRNRQIPRNPLSIHGFSNFNVQVLVGTSFDPRLSIRSQFAAFPVGMAVSSDQEMPWSTLKVVGFEHVTQLYVASSASVDLDDIVVARWEPAPGAAPEPEAEAETAEATAPGAGSAIPGADDEATEGSSGTAGGGRQP